MGFYLVRIDMLTLYLNPPYYGTEKYYEEKFSKEDHLRLYNKLKNIKGKVILSYNNCDFIKDTYKDFDIREVSRNNNLNNRYDNKDKIYKEIIIKNY
ncbi:DNA adenine methylase [Clostridium felsineum]|uniref:DNA adenine methylase n=1 Tax=Clostridium felsineum TaxID=36839 RepID=UPI00358DCB31